MYRRFPAMVCAASATMSAIPAKASGLTDSALGEARAEVIEPITVTRQSDLDFGSIFAATTPGTVTVTVEGQAIYTGGTQSACIGGACAGPRAAYFAVKGEAGRSYVISLPGEITATGTISDGSGAAAPPLTVGAITVRSASLPSAGPAGQIDPLGHDHFEVGGTLQAPAGLPSAHYRATIPVIVSYS